jgi:hypothetical protein
VLRRLLGSQDERRGRRLETQNEELLLFELFNKFYWDDQIKESGVGGTYSTHRRDEKFTHKFSGRA